MSDHTRQTSFGSSDWLMGAVKKNPEGLLLVAAGCALLMRSRHSASARSGSSRSDHESHSRSAPGRASSPGGNAGVKEGVTRTADIAREHVSDMSQSISGAASEYVSTVGDYADKTRRTIVEGSEHLAEQARSTMQTTIDRVLREQPLAVAVAGVAAGALLAAAFPASSIERETLGPAGERLSEAATKTGRQLKEAAAAAGEHAMDAAEERGLTSGGLKEMASEVADTFGKTFSGEMKVKTGSSSGPTDPQPTTADPASQGFASDRTRAGRDSSGGSGSTGGSSNSG